MLKDQQAFRLTYHGVRKLVHDEEITHEER